MPFNTNYNGFNNNGNQNNGGNFGNNSNKDDKHYKFPKIYGDDSYLASELWISGQGAKAILRVYSGVPNPGTGKMTFEEGKPSTLPAVYLGLDEIAALAALKDAKIDNLTVSHTRGTRTISIAGSPAGIKLTIAEDGKGNPRSITFRQYFGFNGGWTAFMDIIQKIYDKMIVSRVPDDFGAAMGDAAPTPVAETITDSAESPF